MRLKSTSNSAISFPGAGVSIQYIAALDTHSLSLLREALKAAQLYSRRKPVGREGKTENPGRVNKSSGASPAAALQKRKDPQDRGFLCGR